MIVFVCLFVANTAPTFKLILKKQHVEMDKDIAAKTQEVNELTKSLEQLKSQESEATRSLQDASKRMEALLNKRSVIMQKREDVQKKIREIGSVPAEALAKFKDENMSRWLKALQDTNSKLKSYSHVNKKALDQFVNFTEQKEQLQSRKKELDDGEVAIAQLVETLDRQKDEAIERTFKGVAKFFSQTFSELTGGGKASLVRQRKFVRSQGWGSDRWRALAFPTHQPIVFEYPRCCLFVVVVLVFQSCRRRGASHFQGSRDQSVLQGRRKGAENEPTFWRTSLARRSRPHFCDSSLRSGSILRVR